MQRFKLITDSNNDLITLAEAKLHTRVDTDADDSLITGLIKAARKWCERYTNRSFVNQIWEGSFDYIDICNKRDFYLPFGDIQSITSVNFYDEDNTAMLVDPANYRYWADRFAFNSNYNFPSISNYRNLDTFIIRWIAGYGTTAADVPDAIKEAILLLIGHWYENRGAIYEAIGGKSDLETLPLGVIAILDAYRIYEL